MAFKKLGMAAQKFKIQLLTSTGITSHRINLQLMHALHGTNNPGRQKAIADALKADSQRFKDLLEGKTSLTFTELTEALKKLDEHGFALAPKNLLGIRDGQSPLSQRKFHEAVRQSTIDLKSELERLRSEAKKERGYIKKAFGIFSSESPLDTVLKDVASFDKYCKKKGIIYDTQTNHLVPGGEKTTAMEKIKDMRFLIAAVGGIGLGAGGVNLAKLPLLGDYARPLGEALSTGASTLLSGLSSLPISVSMDMSSMSTMMYSVSLFFGALPWLAAPFIGLNIFQAFVNHDILKNASIVGRFLSITAIGLGLAALTVATVPYALATLFPNALPLIDPTKVEELKNATMGGAFSPMMYMPWILGGFAAAAGLYKGAKSYLSKSFNFTTKADNVRAWCLHKTMSFGAGMEKATNGINKLFPTFINYVGLPAVAILLSHTIATQGVGLLGQFANCYATLLAGMALSNAVLLGHLYKMGCRGKDFKEVFSVALRAFSISSSSAVLPREAEALKAMGVSKKTRKAGVPLAGVFNLYGTANYMGTMTFFMMAMFGVASSPADYLAVAGAIAWIAMGAPAVPSSNITLIAPVMKASGLSQDIINKGYTIILPADRLLDMAQTGINAQGDMWGLIHKDKHRLRYKRAKNINDIRAKRLAARKAPAA